MAKTEKEQRARRGKHPNSLANLKRFVPGKSGNPAGRPAGAKDRATVLRKWLEVEVDLTQLPPGAPAQRGTVEEQVALALISKAITGDVPAIKELQDTLHGKIPDKLEVKRDPIELAREAFQALQQEFADMPPELVAQSVAKRFGVNATELITEAIN